MQKWAKVGIHGSTCTKLKFDEFGVLVCRFFDFFRIPFASGGGVTQQWSSKPKEFITSCTKKIFKYLASFKKKIPKVGDNIFLQNKESERFVFFRILI